MDKDRIKGATQKAVGAAKDAAGKATGDDKLRVEGAKDKAVGTAKEAAGKIKDEARKSKR